MKLNKIILKGKVINMNYLRKNFNIYFFSFILYCFVGWLYEVALELFVYNNGFINRGFLYGPYLPVYGFGAIVLILLLKNFSYQKRYIKKINISPIITFILIFIVTTLIEYFTGYMLDLILNIRLWDYSNQFLNINGFVCFSASIRFAIGGTIFLYLVQPNFVKLINKISRKTQNLLVFILMSIILTDLVVTLLKYL